MSNDADTRKLVGRRGFLKGAAVAPAAMAVSAPELADAQTRVAVQAAAAASAGATAVPAPTPEQVARETSATPPQTPTPTVKVPGSDLMVEVLKRLGVEFCTSNPGSSFEALQESLVNYGDKPNTMPEFITCLHEETAVDMATGYGKAEGKPMVALLHGTLGLQHASMAIYQAYYGGVPMVIIAGRDDGFIQAHTANDMAAMVRSFTKWDAHPKTLPEALDVLQEAYRQAITAPTGPVVVILDTEIQKAEGAGVAIPTYRPPVIPGIDAATAERLAARLLAAKNPRLSVGKLRTPEGVKNAVKLAELVGASTATQSTSGPMSFPNRHPACGPGADTAYDFTLGLESGPADVAMMGPTIASIAALRDKMGVAFGGLRASPAPTTAPGGGGSKIGEKIDIDAEASLPALIAVVEKAMTPARRRAIADRVAKNAAANQKATVEGVHKALEAKRVGWNNSPVSLGRIYAELAPLIENEDWCLASPTAFSGSHHRDLWNHDKPYSYLGPQPAGGIGYGAGASAGAGLAARERKRIVINIQTDGDMNFAPGVLWTEAHHGLPVLSIMHNNRAWHQELMFLEFMAGARGRGTDRAHIGSTLRDPFIDYKKMAEAYGVAGEGPITDPNELAAAFKRGIASVKAGKPYLIDVITQPR